MEALKVTLILLFVGYALFMNLVFRMIHPSYTETELFLSAITFCNYEIKK